MTLPDVQKTQLKSAGPKPRVVVDTLGGRLTPAKNRVQRPPQSLPLLPLYQTLQNDIVACNLCPRLRTHCTTIAATKRAAFKDHTYWAKPIPNLGDPSARLLILGLAPAAHGANRTGRMFTGDRSGDFLFEAMHATGFCNQPTSVHKDDGLELIDCLITATAHCAPPDNKPLPEEISNCQRFLDRTIDAMPVISSGKGGILALGKIGFDAALTVYKRRGWLPPKTPRPTFAHGALYEFENAPFLIATYHPSQQNTFTGKLTQPMLQKIFRTAHSLL
jgi:uracil-DNA glycosylase family 4